jgi:hypothetical protein
MRVAQKEAFLVGIGLASGVFLMLLTSDVGRWVEPGFSAWGWPFTWRYGLDLMGTRLNWTSLVEDVLFWIIASLAGVETVSHVGVPVARRLLRSLDPKGGRRASRVAGRSPLPFSEPSVYYASKPTRS